MKFQLCNNDIVVSEIHNDRIKFSPLGSNFDPIEFDIQEGKDVNNVKLDMLSIAKFTPIFIRGFLCFPPFSLTFKKDSEEVATYVVVRDNVPPRHPTEKATGRLWFTGHCYSRERSEARKYIYGPDLHWNINEIVNLLSPTGCVVVSTDMIDAPPPYICSTIRDKYQSNGTKENCDEQE